VPTAVILSEAKDLHLLVMKEILQMLRSAQHDRDPFSAACEAPPFLTRDEKSGLVAALWSHTSDPLRFLDAALVLP